MDGGRILLRETNIFLTSDSRDTGDIYNFSKVLPTETVQWDDEEEECVVSLEQFAGSYSWYGVSSRNSTFTYTENYTPLFYTPTAITLALGNYSTTSMATELQTKLNASGSLTWTVVWSRPTNKYTFTYTGSPAGTVAFIFDNQEGANNILGFSVGSVATFSSPSLTSSVPVDVGTISNLYLHLNWVNENIVMNSSGADEDLEYSQALACIPVKCNGYFAPILWVNTSVNSPFMVNLGKYFDNELRVSIRDIFGNLVEMTKDFSFVLKARIYAKERGTTTIEKLLAYLLDQTDNGKIDGMREKVLSNVL